MAWSEAARRAALEARRRKRKAPIKVKYREGKKNYSFSVPRQDYAAYLRDSRSEARRMAAAKSRRVSIKARNRWARRNTRGMVVDEGLYDD